MSSEEGNDGIFAPLRQATFRNLWLSSTVSNTGRPMCVWPPLPGVTPPTICVP